MPDRQVIPSGERQAIPSSPSQNPDSKTRTVTLPGPNGNTWSVTVIIGSEADQYISENSRPSFKRIRGGLGGALGVLGGVLSYENVDPKGNIVDARYFDAGGNFLGDRKGPDGTIYNGKQPVGKIDGDGKLSDQAAQSGYKSDKSIYDNPAYAQQSAGLDSYFNGIKDRPVAQAGPVTVGQAQQAAAVNLGPALQSQGVTLAPAAQADGVTIKAAPQARASLAGPAVQAQDSAVRGNLLDALQYQGGLMKGENSVAALQYKRLSDQAMAGQMSMQASARPGQAAMAQRLAAQNMGRISGDMAGRLQEAQLAERNAAAQQYGNLGGLIRGQDNQLGMFNAGEQNQTGRLNAQLGTQVNMGNANNATSTNIAQGQLSGQIGMFNAGQKNQTNWKQGDLTQQNNQFNAGEGNKVNIEQGRIDTSNNQFNAGEANKGIFQQADIDAKTGMFNAGERNTADRARDILFTDLERIKQKNLKDYQDGLISYDQMLNSNSENRAQRENLLNIAKIQAQAGNPSMLEKIISGAGDVFPLLTMFNKPSPAPTPPKNVNPDGLE